MYRFLILRIIIKLIWYSYRINSRDSCMVRINNIYFIILRMCR